ncbi:MAG: DinB family protein [Cyclobacteriaceae bacterium]
MKKEIENRLLLLTRETDLIFIELESFEDELLRKKGMGWSIIQVLSHLNMAESISLEYMKKKVKAGRKMSKVNVVNGFRKWVTCGFLQTGLKWRAPAYISNPNGEYSLDEIKSTWETTRNGIRKYVEHYPEDLLNRAVYKHPMAGRLSLIQAVDSFIYHQRHHVHQINRIKKELQR